MVKTIQVMLVEDHPEYRDTVEFALEKESDMELSSQFGTAERALHHLQDQHAAAKADIVLLDLNLPGISGLESISQFRSTAPNVRIIVLTQSDNEADVLRAISLGASGYLLKSSALRTITDDIRIVMEGGATLDGKVASYIFNKLRTQLPPGEMDAVLTERETEVLSLLSEGLGRKEIAKRLFIANRTVSSHIESIYEKLGVKNGPAAISRAFRLGLFPLG